MECLLVVEFWLFSGRVGVWGVGYWGKCGLAYICYIVVVLGVIVAFIRGGE